MSSEKRLKDVTEFIGRGITPSYIESGGVPVINQKCIRNGFVDLRQARQTDPKKRSIASEKALKAFDILVNSTGVGTLGRVGQLFNVEGQHTVDSHVTIVRPDTQLIDPVYLGYVVKNLQPAIEALAEGSTGQTELSRHKLAELSFVELDRDGQKFLGDICKGIDDRITLLRETNATLEAIAQALFKSWFVDFDPVRAKMEGRVPEGMDEATAALFPDSFKESELGLVPNGWMIRSLGELVTPKRGKSITKAKCVDGEVPVVAGGMEPAYFHNQSNVNGPVVTISSSGANAGFTRLYYEKIWASDCSYISQEQSNNVFFWYTFLKLNQEKIYSMQQGAVQPHIYPSDIMRLQLALPESESIQNIFEDLVSALFEQIGHSINKANSLASLRDTLLPRLISGQLRVPEAEELIATTM